MVQAAGKMLTFEEFAALKSDGRHELVNGRLDELVPPKPLHGWVFFHFPIAMAEYLVASGVGGYWGGEVDIPTIPFHGRRPDFVYYAPEKAARIDLKANRVSGAPTLAVEIVSDDDEARDTVTKRAEYARAGIPHYWILDPQRETVVTMVLRGDSYEIAGEFSMGDSLTSELFPGLELPLRQLFPE